MRSRPLQAASGDRGAHLPFCSAAHEFSPKPDFSSIEAANQEMKNTWQRYGQSKLVRCERSALAICRELLRLMNRDSQANVLFTTALQERVQNEKIYVSHPRGQSCPLCSLTFALSLGLYRR